MKIKIIILAYLLIARSLVSAQTDTYILDSLVSNLDTSKLVSSTLYDVMYDGENFLKYDGASDTLSINYQKWRSFYASISDAQLKSSTGLCISDLVDTIATSSEQLKIPIGIINMKYDKIKDNAFTDSLLVFNDGKFSDGSNNSESPYVIGRFFAASVLAESIKNSNVKFIFNNIFNFIEHNDTISYYLVDFDDGNGYDTVSVNEIRDISYSTDGTKNIKIEAFTNVGLLKCNTSLTVLPVEYNSPNPNSRIVDTCIVSDVYNNVSYSGQYAIFYGANNTTVKNPIIIVEGFDPNQLNTIRDGSLYDIANQQNLLDSLRNRNYDIILLNFGDGGGKIQGNAMVLRSLINKVNAMNDTDSELVIIGASMGGLVANYALSYMEFKKEVHKTRLNISIDSPHNGAFYPLCSEYLINQLHLACEKSDKMADKIGEKIKPLYKFFSCDAAKQMLYYYVDEVGLHNNDMTSRGNVATVSHVLRSQYIMDSYTLSFYGLPVSCKNIALSCGSGLGNNGMQYGYDSNYNPYINVDKVNNADDLKIELYMKPTSSAVCEKILHLDIMGRIPYLRTWVHPHKSVKNFNVYLSDALPYDHVPGGYYSFINPICDIINNDFNTTIPYDGVETLVPTSSAFKLPSSYLRYDFLNSINFVDNSYEVESYNPFFFDAIYVKQENKPHITGEGSITPGMRDWMLSQISSENLILENKNISNSIKRYRANKCIVAGRLMSSNQSSSVTIQNNSAIKFTASKSIYLGPGFSVGVGSRFTADIK